MSGSPPSWNGATDTFPVGSDVSRTVYVAVAPSSTVRETGDTATPLVSSSAMTNSEAPFQTISRSDLPVTATEMVSSSSSMLSSTGRNVKEALPDVAPASSVRRKSSTLA